MYLNLYYFEWIKMNYNMLWLLRFDLTGIFFKSCIYQFKFKNIYFVIVFTERNKNVVPLLKMQLEILNENTFFF